MEPRTAVDWLECQIEWNFDRLWLFSEETEHYGSSLVQLLEVDPFVRRVGLGDVSRAEDYGGSAAHGDGRGVREVVHSMGLAPLGGFEELLNRG